MIMVRKVIHRNLRLSLVTAHERRTMVEMEIVYEIGLFPVGKWNSKLKLQDILPCSTVCIPGLSYLDTVLAPSKCRCFYKAIFLGELEFPLVNDNL